MYDILDPNKSKYNLGTYGLRHNDYDYEPYEYNIDPLYSRYRGHEYTSRRFSIKHYISHRYHNPLNWQPSGYSPHGRMPDVSLKHISPPSPPSKFDMSMHNHDDMITELSKNVRFLHTKLMLEIPQFNQRTDFKEYGHHGGRVYHEMMKDFESRI